MAFFTKLDYSNNRQIKQFQLTNTQLSGTTTFGVDDALIPMNITGDTINIDALQYIQARGIILPTAIPEFTGTTYQLLGRDNATGKIVEVTGLSGGTSGGTSDYVSNVALVGTNLNFTGVGSAFSGTVDLGNFVTLDTTQTITGVKTITGPLQFLNSSNYITETSGDLFYKAASRAIIQGGSVARVIIDSGGVGISSVGGTTATRFYFKSDLITTQRVYQGPDKDGTLALVSDISGTTEGISSTGTIVGGDLILTLGTPFESIQINQPDGITYITGSVEISTILNVNGIQNNDAKISEVGDGTLATDAVNKGQLDTAISGITSGNTTLFMPLLSGATNLDWNAGTTFLIEINNATITLTDVNLPPDNSNKVITIYNLVGLSGDSITVPSYWAKDIQSDDFIGNERNRFTVESISGTTGQELVYYSITNLD